MINEKINFNHENIKFKEDRFGHDKRYSINKDKIYNDLGWKPKYKFDQEMKSYIEKILNDKEI